MEFRLHGPPEVIDRGSAVAVDGAKRRVSRAPPTAADGEPDGSRLVGRPGQVLVAALLAIVLGSCGGDDEPPVAAPAKARAVASTSCSPMTYGGEGAPRFVVGVVGPFQGAFSDHGIQNAQAVKLVLQSRGWAAGDERVAVQVCDESSARKDVDLSKCSRVGRALADNPSVIAVIGPTTSSCATAMLPALNSSRADPVPVVSPGTTYLGLTRKGPGVAPGHPERLYPTGVRNYVRLSPPDDAQAAAAAMVARQAGARRTFAVHDHTDYGSGAALAFQAAAPHVGLQAAGTERWDARADGYRELAARIARSGADAVYVAGYITSNGPRLIRDLRRGLGRDVPVFAPDGFNQPTAIVEGAGADADGVTLTLATAPNSALPAEGRRWAAAFLRRFGARPCCYAVNAGQAIEVVMDAIDRSDGSRVDVLERLRSARVRDGLLGDFSFDEYGDTTLRTVALYRIENGRLRFEKTVEIPAELLVATRATRP
jgi:branched-chain amino acid transport system substrate-binding protein